MAKIKFSHPALEYSDENNGKDYIMVEGKMQVCPSCGGHGRHDRRDIDCSRLVDSMMEDGDDEGLEAYYRGAYDVVCEQCNGRNVVVAPDWDLLPEWARKDIEDWDREERYSRAIEAAERRMGA